MIKCKRSYNIMGIYEAMDHCFDDVAEDDTDRECIDFSVHKECWLEFTLNGQLVGFIQFKPYNRTTLDIHPYIFKHYRRFSKQCGKMAIDWFNKESPAMYRKLISQVPSCYKHIKRYTLSLGFTHEGTHTNSFLKDGKLLDLWLFGYERLECQ